MVAVRSGRFHCIAMLTVCIVGSFAEISVFIAKKEATPFFDAVTLYRECMNAINHPRSQGYKLGGGF